MALVRGGVTLLEAQVADSFHEVHLLIHVVVRELIVVGIVERFREGVADVVGIGERAKFCRTVLDAHDQAVVPRFRPGTEFGDAVRYSGKRVSDRAGNVVSGAAYVWRGGSRVAKQLPDDLPLSEHVQAVRR